MTALLVIDLQNDFCPGGALAVPDGDAVIPVVNRLVDSRWPLVLTQDWHPDNHQSFASQHPGREPLESVEMPYGEQILWPDHCIQGTQGADFHPDFDAVRAELIVRKGFRAEIDSYSAFRENDQRTATGLAGYLRERGIEHLVMAGLATDFCVRWSVEDARREGFVVTVVEDAVRGINQNGSLDAAWRSIREAAAEITTSDALLERTHSSELLS